MLFLFVCECVLLLLLLLLLVVVVVVGGGGGGVCVCVCVVFVVACLLLFYFCIKSICRRPHCPRAINPKFDTYSSTPKITFSVLQSHSNSNVKHVPR